jgi:uncharacterized protein (TIGR02145 family)
MDKPNVFRTSEFYLSEGDILHIEFIDETGDTVDVDLVVEDSGEVSDSTTYRVTDKDGNLYRTIIIGNQEWMAENLKVTKYADDSPIQSIAGYNDWFLPSKDELNLMYTELKAFGLGSFSDQPYASSSEDGSFSFFAQNFLDGTQSSIGKGSATRIRACRFFTSATSYSVRDMGQSGGYVFWKSGNDYLEASPSNHSTAYAWSNVSSGVIGTNTAIGTGQANTTAIIGQAGHTDSAAKLCDDLTGDILWARDTTGAYCWYNNDIINKSDYGALYNWYAVDNAVGLAYLERGGVHDSSWRVPSAADWSVLATLLGGNAVAGGVLKSTGYDYFDAPNTGATDEYKFGGRAGGNRGSTGVFASLRTMGYYYQSDIEDGNYKSRILFNTLSSFGTSTALTGINGFSVRLVRDI